MHFSIVQICKLNNFNFAALFVVIAGKGHTLLLSWYWNSL